MYRRARNIPGAYMYLHDSLGGPAESIRFSSIVDLTREIFAVYEGIVYFTPCGVAVRAIAPNIRDKHTDPAIVVVDAGGRYAVSLLSGHEGGANLLTLTVSNILGAEPVISTTTEAVKSVIMGVGCRRGTDAPKIVDAIRRACVEAGAEMSEVRLLASADIKSNEEGLLAAAEDLGVPIRFICSDDIRRALGVCARESEPACGRRTSRAAGGEEDEINTAKDSIRRDNCGDSKGKLFVVGIGPGGPLDRTHRAEQAISQSSVVVGYFPTWNSSRT